MGRRRAVQSGAFVGVVTAALAVVLATGSGFPAPAGDPGAASATAGSSGGGSLAGLPASAFRLFAMPVDTPPPVRAAEGWPFEPLPLVIKGQSLPDPRIAVPFSAPVYDLFTQAVVATLNPTPDAPVAGSILGQLPWLLLPPVAGVAILAQDEGGGGNGGGDGEGPGGEEEPPPGAIVPEPSTWLLLATGLALFGIAARFRKRRAVRLGRIPRPGRHGPD